VSIFFYVLKFSRFIAQPCMYNLALAFEVETGIEILTKF